MLRKFLLYVIILGLGLIAAQNYWVPKLIDFVLFLEGTPAPQSSTENPATLQRYSNEKYGVSFSYPDTYAITETDAPGSGERLHHVIVLINKKDLPLPETGEDPPAITIDIYQNNLDKQTTEGWIKNTSASNFKLGEGTLANTTISGLDALSYRWSGLYEGTTVALARPNWVYAFTVTYLEMGADIIQDFVQIKTSVRISE